jgi:hypothetical protein
METNPVNDQNDLEILKDFVQVLENLGIRYALGGSIASSFYGKVRFTADADITVEPFIRSADKLYQSLKSAFYISEDAMYQALKARTSFNIIHLQTSFKIDVFICKDIPFQIQMLQHPRKLQLSRSIDKLFSVVSPEDIILLKLLWFQSSGRASEKQWADILGVLKIQYDKLDYDYLKKWAVSLELSELLEKALSEVNDFKYSD